MRSLMLLVLAWSTAAAAAAPGVQVGSKRFTESYILGEILTQAVQRAGVPATHRQGLGNTAIVLAALRAGAIDVYPEYTGTIEREILGLPQGAAADVVTARLRALGLGMAVPLGFNDTYALAVRATPEAPATVSALAARPGLRLGLSHEFLGRADGWPGLARAYGLPQQPVGLDHGLAYAALAAGQVDAIDIYSTDARIAQYQLRVLADDRHFFPRYDAVLLYRLDLPTRSPAAWRALTALTGRIDGRAMVAMNAAAELHGQSFAALARGWLAGHAAPPAAAPGLWQRTFGADFWPLTARHAALVGMAVLLACLLGIPLGIAAAHRPRLREPLLAVVGMVQTVPALALLAMLIPLLGAIGTGPALLALFLYALLPIVRTTCVGLLGVPTGLRLAAQALGLRPADRLWRIELPLALPVLLAGVQTAAVTSVGTATIAALIGAGGYGERITTGLALNDTTLMLAGALPAAGMALLTQAAFTVLERLLVPKACASSSSGLR